MSHAARASFWADANSEEPRKRSARRAIEPTSHSPALGAARIGFILIATASCGAPPDGSGRDGERASATSSVPPLMTGASTSASLPASASAPAPSSRPKAVVEIPATDTPEPTTQEWEVAPQFNTRATPERQCQLWLLREWFRFGCNDGGIPTLLEGLPGKGFATRFAGDAYIVGRLRRGDLFVAQDTASMVDVYARIAWPSEAPGPTIAEVWRDAAGGLAVYPEEPQALPQIPDKPGQRPRPGDWVLSTPVNMGPADQRPKNCEIRVLRDWLQWRCHGRGVLLKSIQGFGVENVDHFKVNGLWHQQGEGRLHAGMSAALRIENGIGGPVVSIGVRWPADAPQPAEVFMTEPSKR